MENPIPTITLVVLAAMSIFAGVRAILSLRQRDRKGSTVLSQKLIVAVILAASMGLLIGFRVTTGSWQPITSHRDGLVLMACLLSIAILFIQSRDRLAGLSAFALPVLTFLLGWAVCASAWTYQAFHLTSLHPVWRGVHLTGVYLGTATCGLAGVAGVMYLYVQSALKNKDNLGGLGRMASLEALEALIIRAATLGFVLLTLGLVSGFIIAHYEGPGVAGERWIVPKVAMAVGAWLVYALLMNVRYASAFRGRRAAWLSVIGVVLLLGVYIAITSMPGRDQPQQTISMEGR